MSSIDHISTGFSPCSPHTSLWMPEAVVARFEVVELWFIVTRLENLVTQ